MAKRVDPLKAKAARQKKIAIGLGLVFVAVLAFQGPRTLKMLKGPSTPAPEATPAHVTPPAASPTVAPVATPPSVAGAPTGSEPAVLASSDLPAPGPGQLLSFERFTSKDPFAQQVEVSSTPTAEAPFGDGTQPTPAPSAEEPTATETEAPVSSGGGAVPAAGGGASAPVAPAPAAPTEPAAAPATQTLISVNGVSGPADVGKEFPAEDPIFVLVSFASDGKSVQIGIAGGTYADGKDTITLKLGKPLTLQNTADGSRYELVLESVAGFVTPTTKK